MITVFSIPKSFTGAAATSQLNALESWTAIADAQVVLVGDEPGTADAAAEFHVEHLAEVGTSDLGTPRVDDAFALVDAVARHPIRCFVNADIILLDDFVPAVRRVQESTRAFLMIGEALDLQVDARLPLIEASARAAFRRQALAEGASRGATAIDYFVFTAGLFDPVPPFVVGRARFDNWLVWRGRERGIVVDASRAVVAVHQRHDYGHVRGGLDEAHFGVEAERNLDLAGGKRHLYTIHDASHRLTADRQLRRNLAAAGRLRENLRKIAWKLSRR